MGLGMALLTPSLAHGLASWSMRWWAAAMDGARGSELPGAPLGLVLAPLGLAAAALVAGHLWTGALGPISPRARRDLRPDRVRVWTPLLALAALGLVVLFAFGKPALAGGARAVDATGPALRDLWQTWFMRGSAQVGAVLVGLGILEGWVRRRAIGRALYLTPEQSRRERREAGPR